MDDSIYQRLLKAVKNNHGITLQPSDVSRIVLGLEAMVEDIGKLQYLVDYFEYRYNQYVAKFGELSEDETEQEGPHTESGGDDTPLSSGTIEAVEVSETEN